MVISSSTVTSRPSHRSTGVAIIVASAIPIGLAATVALLTLIVGSGGPGR